MPHQPDRPRLYLALCGLCLSLFWVLLPSAHARKKSCLELGSKRCTTQYKAAQKACVRRYRYSSIKGKCLRERKRATKRCHLIWKRAQKRCGPLPMTRTQLELCDQAMQKKLDACSKLKQKKSLCKEKMDRCQKLCFRTCQICTPQGVKPCTNLCKAQRDDCLGEEQETYLRCTRRAIYTHRDCKRKRKLQAWDSYFRCIGQAKQDYLRCYWASRDEYSACIDEAKDRYSRCKRKNELKHAACILKASQRCKAKAKKKGKGLKKRP